MLENIGNFIMANAYAITVVASIVLLVVLYQNERVKFRWVDFWATFPFLGTIAMLSKNENVGANGWMVAEEKLCSIYKQFVPNRLSESQFKQRIEYMKAAGDLGRTPTPIAVYIFLFILVAAESAGFAYLLGQVMAGEASERIYTYMMVAIMFVIATIFPFLMHSAGHQLYRTKLLQSHHKDYKKDNGDDYAGNPVAANDDQFADKAEANYTRCLSRVAKDSRDKGSYVLVWIAGIAIVTVLCLTTYMRYSHYQASLTDETALLESTVEAGNPFADAELEGLPDEITEPQEEADKKAKDESQNHKTGENLAGFIVLGVLFLITQLVGIIFGYRYGFVGKETFTKEKGIGWVGPYKDTRGFKQYDAYWSSFDQDIDLVNSRLKALQNKLKDLHSVKNAMNKTFRDYLQEKLSDSERGKEHAEQTVKPRVAASAKVAEEQSVASGSISLGQAKAGIDACVDKAEEKAYFQGLPVELQTQLVPWLKERKKAEEQRKQLGVDVDELF